MSYYLFMYFPTNTGSRFVSYSIVCLYVEREFKTKMCEKFGLCKRCKRKPVPIVPRRRVLAAALMCQVAGFTLMTIGFFTPGWKLQSFRQRTDHKGLWFDMVCLENKSCTAHQNVVDFCEYSYNTYCILCCFFTFYYTPTSV